MLQTEGCPGSNGYIAFLQLHVGLQRAGDVAEGGILKDFSATMQACCQGH
jgi:hypothetical protein